MYLTEQHVINRDDPRFAVLDAAAFKSKNLYNAANYEIRQAFIHQGVYLNYSEMQKRMQSHEAYKEKVKGRNLLTYTLQALKGGQSKQGIQGKVKPSGLTLTIKTQQQAIHQVRIIPGMVITLWR
jgi:putative transposase